MPILRKDDNTSDNFGPYKNEESTLEGENIEKNDIDLVNKSLDIRSYTKNILSE